MSKFIERKSQEVLVPLSTAPIYKKQGTVNARLGIVGEEIATILANGTSETVNTVKADNEWVTTNPLGEQYIISEKKFNDRYEPTAVPGVYQAKGYSRILPNPFKEDIEILASWGSPQFGGADCYFADICTPEGVPDGEPYLLGNDEFESTYATGLVG